MPFVSYADVAFDEPVTVWISAFTFVWFMPRDRIAGSCGNFAFNILRKFYTVFCSRSTSLNCCTSLGFCTSLPAFIILLIAILMGMEWWNISAFLNISVISDVEHLFLCDCLFV